MKRPMWIMTGVIAGVFVAWVGLAAISMALQNQQRADAEKKFIAQMIPHHDAAIMMAKMAQQKGQVAQIKNMADGIIESQQQEIDQMRVWHKAWFGKDIETPEMSHSGHGMTEMAPDLSKLNDADDFDLEFVKEMIPHHEQAVKMAQDFLPNALHPELKNLAQDIIADQNDEIAIMKDLQKTFEQYPLGSIGRNDMSQQIMH